MGAVLAVCLEGSHLMPGTREAVIRFRENCSICDAAHLSSIVFGIFGGPDALSSSSIASGASHTAAIVTTVVLG